jgi:uncharacterized glyoxalase superfamily protein PhnB
MATPLKPNLGYRDAAAAIHFLVTAFGFEEVAVYEGPAGSIAHAELRWPGGGSLTLYSAGSDRSSLAGIAAAAEADGSYPSYSIHLDTDQPDTLFARAVAAGAAVVRPVEDSPLGTRGFVVRDPEGLTWSAGTPLPRLVRGPGGRWQPAPDESSG